MCVCVSVCVCVCVCVCHSLAQVSSETMHVITLKLGMMIQDLPRMHHILIVLTLNEGQGHNGVKVTFFKTQISPEPFNQFTPNLLRMIALTPFYKIIASPMTLTKVSATGTFQK